MMGERWEKIAQQAARECGLLSVDETVTLLRREHAAMVKAMKKLTRYDVNKDYHENQMYLGTFKDGMFVRLSDVLAALATRKKGGG